MTLNRILLMFIPSTGKPRESYWLGLVVIGLWHAVQVYWCILCINPPSRFVHDYVFHHLYGFLWPGSSGVWISDVIFWCPSNGKWSASPPLRQISLPHSYLDHYLLDTMLLQIQVHYWQANPSSAIQHSASKRDVTPNLFCSLEWDEIGARKVLKAFLPLTLFVDL